jgi:phospholipase/lecithinase/hemolysin
MFQRYVSMGNSITAGFQSAGINDSTQSRSYAVLLAKAMGTTFVYPSLNMPGCPPPFTHNTTQTRLTPTGFPVSTGASCYLRAGNATPNDVAVPGARATEILTNFGVPVSSSNALTFLFLSGRTQLQAMQDQAPTFVSLWIGNNDVLGSLTSLTNPGNPAFVTPQNAFQAQYTQILDSIEAEGAKAVLISVADVGVIPYASRGSVYWCVKNQPACGTFPAAFPPTLSVSNNCAPAITGIPGAQGDSTLVPWTTGLPKLDSALHGVPTTLDCTEDNVVVTPAEYANLRTAVAGYNAFIQGEATSRGFAFVDINAPLLQHVADGTIPPFPDPSQLSDSLITFGPYFSLDGVHPSSLAHQLIADSVASAINQKYGTTLPVPVCGTVICPATSPPAMARSRR